MRLTILFTFLALAACKKADPGGSKGTPTATTDRGFLQEFEGHHAAIIVNGDVTLVIPLDELPRGTRVVKGGKNGTLIPIEKAGDIPMPKICPCCNIRCGTCEPSVIGIGCHPLPSLDSWPGFVRPGVDPRVTDPVPTRTDPRLPTDPATPGAPGLKAADPTHP